MIRPQRAWFPALGIALLALAGSVTSLRHDFTYDDRGVIFENDRVHALTHIPQLFWETYWPPKYGGDGYRPVVTSLFTLQWVTARGAPWLFHLVNIALTVLTVLAVYWCVAAVLPAVGAWVAAALFAVHPVHVEVTGNVVGQSELVVALCLSVAIGLYLRRRMRHTFGGRDVAVIAALFAVALFTKEHAIVLPAVLVAAECTVLATDAWHERVAAIRPLLLTLLAVAMAYLWIRSQVQRDLSGFVPYPVFHFLHMSAVDRIGTMMNEMPRIAQLLLFPNHLSADYSPNDVMVAQGLDVTEIPGLVICAGTLTLAVALRTRARAVSFGLLWAMIAFLPVSNLIVPAGFVIAERTLFFPSIGVVLAAGALAEHVRRHARTSRRRLAAAALALLLVAGLARSIDRQRVWANNDVFFDALMRDAPNGYRARFLHARHVGLKGRLSEMELEYRRAIRMFPYDAGMTLSVADAYTRVGLCQPAVLLFEWTYGVVPDLGDGRYEYVYCLAKLKRWSDARREALIGLRYIAPRDLHLMRGALKDIGIALRSAPK